MIDTLKRFKDDWGLSATGALVGAALVVVICLLSAAPHLP